MSKAEVRATEPTEDWVENETVMAFKTQLNGLDAGAQYQFTNGKLSACGYRILQEHSNKSLYLADYDQLLELLTEKYGQPKDQQTVWANNLYRREPSNYGLAVAAGHLRKWTEWQTERTEITLMIFGDNYQIQLLIGYASRELQPAAEAAKKEKTLKAL